MKGNDFLIKNIRGIIASVLLVCILSVTLFSCKSKDEINNSFDDVSVISNVEQQTSQTDTQSNEQNSNDEISDEVSNKETSTDILISINDINDFKKLELDEYVYELYYQLIKTFIEKDTDKLEELSGLEKGVFDSYKTIQIGKYTISKDKNDTIIFSFEIISSKLDTMPTGQYSYIVDCANNCFFPLNYNLIKFTPAEEKLIFWIEMCGVEFLNYEDLNESDKKIFLAKVSEYLIGNEPLTLEQMQNYALKLFNINDFVPTGVELIDGLYHSLPHGGNSISYDVISQTEENGITTITVQYYADVAKTIKSHTYEYKMKEIEGKWAFLESKILYKSEFKPFSYGI